ncbi:MAG: hypothetical protein EOO15_06365 [Chitinophagaceae bacterium]|nr:MAG: hypothetical protein EOO15_06365 [Chitinophagaceae bacterium]
MNNHIYIVSLAVFIAGCATSHKVPEGRPTAKLSLTVQVEADSTTTRTAYILINDEKCANHVNGVDGGASRNLGSPAIITTEPVKVAADIPLYFTTNYIDSGFAQNRGCSLTGIFTPKIHHNYQARMAVLDNVATCKLGLFDVSTEQEEVVELRMPEYICTGEGGPRVKNGQAMQLNWKVKVIPMSR